MGQAPVSSATQIKLNLFKIVLLKLKSEIGDWSEALDPPARRKAHGLVSGIGPSTSSGFPGRFLFCFVYVNMTHDSIPTTAHT